MSEVTVEELEQMFGPTARYRDLKPGYFIALQDGQWGEITAINERSVRLRHGHRHFQWNVNWDERLPWSCVWVPGRGKGREPVGSS